MTENRSIIFALEQTIKDAVPETSTSEEIVLAIPVISVFSNEEAAIAEIQGINFVEEDIWAFAFDGSPLEPLFSVKPYVDSDRLKYFRGIYTLRAGTGRTLQDMISARLSDAPPQYAEIEVRIPPSDEDARKYGWPNIETMRAEAERALEILPSDLTKLLKF